jgi:hypothetical protein
MSSVAARPTVFPPRNFTTPFGQTENQADGSVNAYSPTLYAFLMKLGLVTEQWSTGAATTALDMNVLSLGSTHDTWSQFSPDAITTEALTAFGGAMTKTMMQYTPDYFMFNYYDFDSASN